MTIDDQPSAQLGRPEPGQQRRPGAAIVGWLWPDSSSVGYSSVLTPLLLGGFAALLDSLGAERTVIVLAVFALVLPLHILVNQIRATVIRAPAAGKRLIKHWVATNLTTHRTFVSKAGTGIPGQVDHSLGIYAVADLLSKIYIQLTALASMALLAVVGLLLVSDKELWIVLAVAAVAVDLVFIWFKTREVSRYRRWVIRYSIKAWQEIREDSNREWAGSGSDGTHESQRASDTGARAATGRKASAKAGAA
jgi:ABC-type multidrug transport system fused ATPase/permease subunit